MSKKKGIIGYIHENVQILIAFTVDPDLTQPFENYALLGSE